MTSRILVTFAAAVTAPLVLIFAACGEPGYFGRSAIPDTLSGFRLGALLPDVRSEVEGRGEPMMCEPGTTSNSHVCRPAWTALVNVLDWDQRGYTSLAFEEGRLVEITRVLGEDWSAVPFDEFRERFGVYGPIPARGHPDSLFMWERESGPLTFQVACAEPGGQCEATVMVHRAR